MKKLSFLFGIVAMIAIVFMGCENGSTPVPEDPPAPPVEEVTDWLDVVPGGFFKLVCVSDYGEFTRSAGDLTVVNDVYIVFEETGDISLWYDNEPNGILEPEDYVGSAGTWELVDGVLTIDGEVFFIKDVAENAWSMTMDISDEFEDCLGEAGYEVTGTRTFCYERAYPTYMTPDMLITTEFPFAFSDRNETGLAYTLEHTCSWWHTYWYLNEEEILLDEFDGFYFTWGDIDIVLLTFDSNDQSVIIVDGNLFFLDTDDAEFVFGQDVVYDMSITVQPNDVAYFEFVSRVDPADTFTVQGLVSYDGLGEIVIRAVDDVAGLVL